jgi:hypothetical protein
LQYLGRPLFVFSSIIVVLNNGRPSRQSDPASRWLNVNLSDGHAFGICSPDASLDLGLFKFEMTADQGIGLAAPGAARWATACHGEAPFKSVAPDFALSNEIDSIA